MTTRRPWLDDGWLAAHVASERAALWLPGAVAWLATVGCVPFLAAVATPPGEGDLVVIVASLVSSGAWQLKVASLLAGLVAAVVAALTVLALAEVVLWDRLRRRSADWRSTRVRRSTIRLLGVELVAAGPVTLALVAAGLALAAVAPDEFGSPDIGGGVWLRLLGRIGPVLGLAIIVLLVSQALGAAAGRRVLLRGQPTLGALRSAVDDLRHAWRSAAGVAFATLTVSIGYAVAVWLLVRVLWSPISTRLAASGFDPAAILLLLGLVAIWLCLVAGGGAVHAWASVWWTLTLARAGAARAVPASVASLSEESRVA